MPLSPSIESVVQTTFGLLVLVIAAGAGWQAYRGASQSRRHEAIVWLALLNLASFRSPMLPDVYAYVGVYVLLALLLATLPRVTFRAMLVVAVAWLGMAPVDGLLTLAPLGNTAIGITLVVQVCVIALNLACALDRGLPDRLARWSLITRTGSTGSSMVTTG